MPNSDQPTAQRTREILVGRLLLLVFGFGVLSFLVAIDHPDWFAIRPATGTSVAMANAAAPVNSEDPATR
ncbi:hypothetical protein HNO88_001202 [Novosphingobium chloroacetimidivorans]|uniref:Uncharacterized protein n=1 Tax=Novosphingobium chloroacetimidivorans TaxID=1428314 RepID=A0A7W7NUV2_9SPHN|nr:hypothetical protein [Novosphingobium chloroacetimidivorans]MBB4857888.1 hypothetical protein [Novosphingobium chloroacetimidivorans]